MEYNIGLELAARFDKLVSYITRNDVLGSETSLEIHTRRGGTYKGIKRGRDNRQIYAPDRSIIHERNESGYMISRFRLGTPSNGFEFMSDEQVATLLEVKSGGSEN